MSIAIILDHYQSVCFPGQTISGRAECVFSQEEKLRAIRIHFKGAAKTKWSESRGSGKSRRTVYYSGTEDYFDHAYNLLEGGEDFTLPAGKYVYPFAYILPLQLPTSCELEYGHIHYKIIGTVDRPWKFDYETEFFFNVASPLDLNYMPALREPQAMSADKEVGCLCFKSGPVNLNISLPITGFIPEQEVNVGCYVQNLSNVSITEVKFKVLRIFEFIVHLPSTKSRFLDDCVFKHIEGGIGAHGEKSWTGSFRLSGVPFLNMMNCSIINISYMLQVEAVLPFPHMNLTAKLPIMIGSIPLIDINNAPAGPPIVGYSLPQYPDDFNLPVALNHTAPVMPQPNSPYLPEETQVVSSKPNDLPTYDEATTEKL